MNEITESAKDARLREWAEQVQEFRNSGKKVSVWCRENNISPKTFSYRLGRVAEFSREQIPVAVARIPSETPSHSEGQPSVTIRTASVVVEISNTASDELIGAILRALKC